jgi:hypothetical protein
MAEAVFLLCAVTSLACAALLLRAYARGRSRLLLWSGLCFVGLAINNGLLVIDRLILPNAVDLSTWRQVPATAAMAILVWGLVWDSE